MCYIPENDKHLDCLRKFDEHKEGKDNGSDGIKPPRFNSLDYPWNSPVLERLNWLEHQNILCCSCNEYLVLKRLSHRRSNGPIMCEICLQHSLIDDNVERRIIGECINSMGHPHGCDVHVCEGCVIKCGEYLAEELNHYIF